MRIAIFLLLMYLLPLQLCSQIADYSKIYDYKKLQLLVQTRGLFIHAANQGTLDLDSAMVLSCIAQNKAVSFSYDEDYADGQLTAKGTFVDLLNQQMVNSVLVEGSNLDKFRLLMKLCGFYLFKPGTLKSDLVAANSYIIRAIALSDSLGIAKWQYLSQTLLGKYYFQSGDGVKGKACLLKVVSDAKTSQDEAAIADALHNAGTYLPLQDSLKVIVLSEAITLYKKIGEHEKEIEALMKLLGIHFRQGNFALAKSELESSMQLQRLHGFKHLHYTLATLSYISEINGNLTEGLSYALESMKTMEATGDTSFADHLYSRLGSIYRGLGQHDKALALYEKLIGKLKTKNTSIWYKNFLATIIALIGLNRDQDALNFIEKLKIDMPPQNPFDEMHLRLQEGVCLNNLGQNNKAEKSYSRMIELADQISSVETTQDVVHCYAKIGLFYANTGNMPKAKYFAEKANSMSVGKIFLYTKIEIEQALFKIELFDRKYPSAIRHLLEYQRLSDTLMNIEKNKLIEELQIKYETNKKEANIEILQKTGALQENQIVKGKQVRDLSLVGIILLVALMSLLYNRYRLKQNTNKLLEKLIAEKESLLEEKDWLVKEIHHRVKNNLQIVTSLMNIQSTFLGSGVAYDAIKESQSRMNAMSLIHQKLYQSPSLVSVDMNMYITELISFLKESFLTNQPIKFEIEVQSIELDVTQAVPIGLILNEAITNSIKYAFPVHKEGLISICLKEINEDLTLTISDNGRGLPKHFEMQKSNSIGMTLIHVLTDQLEGKLQLNGEDGVHITIVFKKETINPHNQITKLKI